MYERALKIFEDKLGNDNQYVAFSLNSLAAISQAEGDCDKAKQLYLRAIRILEMRLGADHPYTQNAKKSFEGIKRLEAMKRDCQNRE